jgi:hypothetical protein
MNQLIPMALIFCWLLTVSLSLFFFSPTNEKKMKEKQIANNQKINEPWEKEIRRGCLISQRIKNHGYSLSQLPWPLASALISLTK